MKNLGKYLFLKKDYILNRIINLKKFKLDYFETFHNQDTIGDSIRQNSFKYKNKISKDITGKKNNSFDIHNLHQNK